MPLIATEEEVRWAEDAKKTPPLLLTVEAKGKDVQELLSIADQAVILAYRALALQSSVKRRRTMMRNKRILFLILTVVCILLPLAAVADTWAEFVDAVNAVTQGATGQVVYTPTDEVVGSCTDTDEALFVPDGVQLVLHGGWYGEMRLGGGDVTLEGAHVITDREEWAAIYFAPNGSKDVTIKLTIDEESEIESNGYNADGLGAWDLYGGNTSITVVNHGYISGDGMGARLLLTEMGDGKSASLAFFNDGMINGTVTGVSLQCESKDGDTDVWFHNAGNIEGENFSGVGVGSTSQRGKATASVWNAEAGELYAAVSPMRLVMDGGAEGSLGTLTNLGICSGPRGLWLATSAMDPVPMRIHGIGDMEDADVEETLKTHVNVDMKLTIKKGEKPPTEKAFAETVTPWLERLGVAELPQEIQIRTALCTLDAEDAQGFLYEQHVRGGGKAQEEPPPHALPPGMNVLPETPDGDDE